MSRKPQNSGRPELLTRNVELTSFSANVGIRAEHRRGEDPFVESGPWLELCGRLDKPVKEVSNVLISTYPKEGARIGTRQPPSVGSIIGLKPEMSVVVSWDHREFDRLWALALSGRLGFAYLCFTRPRYGKALVVSASFSTDAEE